MKKMPIAAKICFFSSLALAIGGTILRTVAMFVCFDSEIGYFDSSFLSTLLSILPFVAVLWPTILAILTPKDILPTLWPEVKNDIPALIPAVASAIGGVYLLSSLIQSPASSTLLVLATILALASAVYYALIVISAFKKPIGRLLFNLLCFSPIFWGLLSIAETYTDQFTTMNSPIKLGLQFGFLSVMLMTVASLRFHFEKPLPRCAMCFYAIAAYFCLSGSIPVLVAIAAGILKNALHGAYAVILLGIGVYGVLQFISYFLTSRNAQATPKQEKTENFQSVIETDLQ